MDIFAIIAGSLCTISFIPQLLRVLKKIYTLSPAFLLMYCLGVINWGLFGLTMSPIGWPLVTISFLQMLFVLVIYIKQRGLV
jgi:uncharacterized protein with PQ loop repeat